MSPEEKARLKIDARLSQSGWTIQDLATINPMASLGVAVREYPTSTGPVDYALFVAGTPVGVVEAKKDAFGENITTVERQTDRADCTEIDLRLFHNFEFILLSSVETLRERVCRVVRKGDGGLRRRGTVSATKS